MYDSNNTICHVSPFMSKSMVPYTHKDDLMSLHITTLMAILLYAPLIHCVITTLRRTVRQNSRPFVIPEESTEPHLERIESEDDMQASEVISEEMTEDPENEKWIFTGRYLELPGSVVLLTTYNKMWRFQRKGAYYYTTQQIVDTLSKQLVKSKD